MDPVNYVLLQVLPPDGTLTDPLKRPFIIFDPRAGQGPGIGGMKRDSEVGLALMDGHPVYFVGFFPHPVEGQTIEDVSKAQAYFLEKIIERHPDAGQPCLIGNCQAGWQITLTSATNPSLPGVLILAGAPLSYWAGVKGKNPMRYGGGMTGGSWIIALASDLGNGLFDGAYLVDNFEKNNPSNTFWKKEYNVYKKIDTEGPRYLEFEKWWISPVLLNREEIHFIVDELFIGNHLVSGKINTSSGIRADLRNIKSPIVVFCSHADDIATPQQALGWILDIFDCDDDILASEQTIIYSMHHKIGHLGIFVSSSVAGKELQKFISNIDMIETLPPGLFEATFVEKSSTMPNPDLASGQYVLRFEKRSLDDIRALGGNDREDDLKFAAVARISENLQGMYYTFVSPFIRSMVTPQSAELMRLMHPLRLKVSSFSDYNPACQLMALLADVARENRRPVPQDNFFWQKQEELSQVIISTLDKMNDFKNAAVEALFMGIYGSPLVQAMIGLKTVRPYAKPALYRDVMIESERNRRLLRLLAQIEDGGLIEATVRGLLYVGRGDRAVDEREYRMLLLLRNESQILPDVPREELRALARRQYMMLILDEDRAISAIPNLLDRAPKGSEKQAFETIVRIVEASGTPSVEEQRRLDRLRHLFAPAQAVPQRRSTDPSPFHP